MAKKVGLKIGVVVGFGVGLYLLYNSNWYKDRYTGFWKKRKKVRDEDVLISDVPPTDVTPTSLGGIYMYNADGSVITEYANTGVDMEFPLQKDLSFSQAFDNVAELQAFLVFANSDNNLAIDGYFGNLTEDAVRAEVADKLDYGYGIYFDDTATSTGALDEAATDAQYNTITEEYFNDLVLSELEYFMNADCLTLYDEATCA